MAVPHPFTPEKLIIGILTSRPALLEAIEQDLAGTFGSMDYRSEVLPFDFTDYYVREMGSPILRRFLAVERLQNPDRLAAIKLATIEMEGRYAEAGKRVVNLDPGFLSSSRLVLASAKDGSQRIPLRDGIYAEVTLTYIRGAFVALPWTYPDYQSRAYQRILSNLRDTYKEQLKQIQRRTRH
jgi:hypothetical protein